MSFDTLTSIPCEITSGESANWQEIIPEYADPTYDVEYRFGGQTPVDGYQRFTVAGTGASTTWDFAFAVTAGTPTVTVAPKPGRYAWQKVIIRASDSREFVIARGFLNVIPDLSVAQTTSTAATLLASINTSIATLTENKYATVSYNGQSKTDKDLGAMMKERIALEAQVLREQNALLAMVGLGKDRNVQTIFQEQQ